MRPDLELRNQEIIKLYQCGKLTRKELAFKYHISYELIKFVIRKIRGKPDRRRHERFGDNL